MYHVVGGVAPPPKVADLGRDHFGLVRSGNTRRKGNMMKREVTVLRLCLSCMWLVGGVAPPPLITIKESKAGLRGCCCLLVLVLVVNQVGLAAGLLVCTQCYSVNQIY